MTGEINLGSYERRGSTVNICTVRVYRSELSSQSCIKDCLFPFLQSDPRKIVFVDGGPLKHSEIHAKFLFPSIGLC